MTKHYRDYYWKDGRPQGLSALAEKESPIGITFKIIADPYFRRTSIEKYVDNNFSQTIYDSALLNFRHLKPTEQTAWQKTTVSETATSAVCHIRNQDDRLVIIEEYTFENNRCRECRAFSPQRVLVSIQKILYEALKDPFNGVILYDSNEHQVMLKRYKLDPVTNEFSELIEESWKLKEYNHGASSVII